MADASNGCCVSWMPCPCSPAAGLTIHTSGVAPPPPPNRRCSASACSGMAHDSGTKSKAAAPPGTDRSRWKLRARQSLRYSCCMLGKWLMRCTGLSVLRSKQPQSPPKGRGGVERAARLGCVLIRWIALTDWLLSEMATSQYSPFLAIFHPRARTDCAGVVSPRRPSGGRDGRGGAAGGGGGTR